MNWLVDTNIILRAAQPGHSMHQQAVAAVAALRYRGETLRLARQNLYEFWVVATRSSGENGLGLTVAEAQIELSKLESLYFVLEDSPAIYPEWIKLVMDHQVRGKSAHDARLAAAMRVYGLTGILTFNAADFSRFSGISAATPDDVLGSKGETPLTPRGG